MLQGLGLCAWTTPENITADDSNNATANISQNVITNYLQATNYGFSIPTGATINGITVVINRSSSGSSSPRVRDSIVSLVKNGTISGSNLAATGTDWGSMATATYGGTSSLWGTTWSAEDINATNFGVVLSVTNTNNNSRTASVDYIQITVTYTSTGTIVGTATATAAGSTSINVSMPYTEDSNGDNTAIVKWVLAGGNFASPLGTHNLTHSASPYADTITGLTPSTSYDVQMTYTDADGVTGTNPQTAFGVTTLSNATTTGTATALAASATSINVSIPYTVDGNANNTYTVEFQLSGSGTWIAWITGAGHVASPYTTTITGLLPSTDYDVRVTYIDPDGVNGTNPQTINSITTPAWSVGSNTWIAPSGVHFITVEVWGGGGRGASISGGYGEVSGGGGGGGGYSKLSDYQVTPGNSYTVFVGAGSTSTSAGGQSYFIDTSTLVANGGSSAANSSSTGGAGATVSTTGDVHFGGGSGAAGSTGSNYGGGGGSSAGTGATGVTATNATGATAPTGGGNGGSGRSSTSGNGSSGSAPGGGGGGAYRSNYSSSYTGGKGADGQVIISHLTYADWGALGGSFGTAETAVFPDTDSDGYPNGYGGQSAIWLGTGVSQGPNAPSMPDPGADGVTLVSPASWYEGTSGGAIDVTFNGSPSGANSGYLVVWFDWNHDGDFGDAGEMVVNQSISWTSSSPSAPQTFTFNVPTGINALGADLNYRARLFASAPGTPSTAYTGLFTNGEVEDYLALVGSLPVTMNYFHAKQQGSSLSIDWSTGTETGNVGFNLYVVDANGKHKLNAQLIPSTGFTTHTPQDYHFAASGILLSGELKFYLEDMDFLGKTMLHGPFTLDVVYGRRMIGTPTDWQQIQAECSQHQVLGKRCTGY